MKVCPDKDFDEIIVVNGPGSFTGVRLGITIAKTLAYTLNKVIKTVSYFDLQNYSLDSTNHILSMNDGNGYFIAEYENHKLIKPLYYLNNKEYNDFSKNKEIITDVSIDFSKALSYIKDIDGVNPHSVKPLYIKLIGVEQ
jgi:tRNA A37 threonylcarbamoyladenosine modification protein TsaB